MTFMEAIRHRRSVRSFDGAPLKAEDAQELLRFAAAVETPYAIPISWSLLDAKKHGLRSPVITGESAYLTGKLQRLPHAEEAFGYAFETVLLYAEALGLGSTWIAGTLNRGAFERAIGLAEGEVMPCVSPIGYPAAKMSLRESLMRKGVNADSRMDFSELFFDGSFEKPLTPERAHRFRIPLELVRLAPSAVNKQPWRALVRENKVHFYEKRSKGYLSADGWDLQKIDLGIALAHFALAAKEQGLACAFSLEDPALPNPDGLVYIATFML